MICLPLLACAFGVSPGGAGWLPRLEIIASLALHVFWTKEKAVAVVVLQKREKRWVVAIVLSQFISHSTRDSPCNIPAFKPIVVGIHHIPVYG